MQDAEGPLEMWLIRMSQDDEICWVWEMLDGSDRGVLPPGEHRIADKCRTLGFQDPVFGKSVTLWDCWDSSTL